MASEHEPHTLRYLGVADLEARPPTSFVIEQSPVVAEVAEQFLGEERVALRLGIDEVDQLGRSVASRAGGEYRPNLVDRHQPGPEIDRSHIPKQRTDRRGQGPPGFQFVVAEGPDDQQRQARRTITEVTQQQQRRLVGPVQILVGEHHRLIVCRPVDELADTMEHVPPLLLRSEVGRRRNVVVALPQRRQKFGHLGRIHAERGAKPRWRRRASSLFEVIDRRLIGRWRFHVEAVAGVHDHPETLRHLGGLAGQSALALARRVA